VYRAIFETVKGAWLIKRLTNEKFFDRPIMTEVTPASEFYRRKTVIKITSPITRATLIMRPFYNQLYKFVKKSTEKIRSELI
jgi:peptide-methionine (S)-S-oxide reductase